MNLLQFPRRRYSFETPIEFLPNLTKSLDGPNIYVKRDDLLNLTEGGNKVRKMEYMIPDAINKGADTIITCGAIQSNHCRLTLAATRKEGLKCILALEERVAGTYDIGAGGNNLLYHLLQADEIHLFSDGIDEEEEMERIAEKVKEKGGKPYLIDGSNAIPISALGYARCANEIAHQLSTLDVKLDGIIVASGSGGMHGGLLAGLLAMNMRDLEVIGINVRRERKLQEERMHNLLTGVLDLIGLDASIPNGYIKCLDDYLPPGYSQPNEGTMEAILMLAKTEAILTDPIYTGKVTAGMIDLIRKKHFKKGQNVLFIHSGGVPALYSHYKDMFVDESRIIDHRRK